MIKYSVIIPVYNAQSTLERCLDSFVIQLRPDVEILVINDGSSDRSSEISHRYEDEHTEIRVLDKENGGVSSARNIGLDNAHGDYILFADSDDYVDAHYFSFLDTLLANSSIDLAMFGIHFFGGRDFSPRIENGAWNGGHFADAISSWIRNGLFFPLWNKVYRREIIESNHIRFDERLPISEDVAFIFSYAVHGNYAVSSEKVLYLVSEENADSLSRRHIERLEDKLSLALAVMRNALQQADLDKKRRRSFEDSLAFLNYRTAYSVAKQAAIANDPVVRQREIRRICNVFGNMPERPHSMQCFLISVPVKFRMIRFIDRLVCLRLKA